MGTLARLAAVLALCAGSLVLVAPADAAVRTSSGLRCTIVGTAGNDKLVGTRGRDVICGRGGRDRIYAGGGNDVVSGGPGNDTIVGGSGRDVLQGDDGNDDLTGNGGDGADTINGGDGTNWCSMDPADTVRRCVYDVAAPELKGFELSRDTVDVTNAAQPVTVRLHVTDDTGVKPEFSVNVSFSGMNGGMGAQQWARLTSGTVRDGWWTANFQVPRWIEAGSYGLDVMIEDRVNRVAIPPSSPAVLQVIDRAPDLAGPELLGFSGVPAGTVVDVRRSDRTLHLAARVTDAVSGVAGVYFCAATVVTAERAPCAEADLVKGTRKDGRWEGELRIPEGSVGGDWEVSVEALDRAHSGDTHYWYGPGTYAAATAAMGQQSVYHALPDGAGGFTVRGVQNSKPPVLTGLTASPASVDTLPAPVTVTVTIQVRDDVGVTRVSANLDPPATGAPGSMFSVVGLKLVSGTRQLGTWRGTITLPQGTAPGAYTFEASVEDRTHWRSYVSASSPSAGDGNGREIMAWDPKVTIVDAS